MTKTIHTTTPEVNRLRAATALIPIIEAGLVDSKPSTAQAIADGFILQVGDGKHL